MLTQTALYALRALIYLARQPDDDYHQTREMARSIRVPPNYLGKTLQKLARARIIDSQKGLHGGFRAAKLPEQLRLYDVLRAVESVPKELEAGVEGVFDGEFPGLSNRFDGLYRLYKRTLMETTLADVMDSAKSAHAGHATHGSRKETVRENAEVVLSI